MSFLEDAREKRAKVVKSQQTAAQRNAVISQHLISSVFNNTPTVLYNEIRAKAMNIFKEKGKIEEIVYTQRWELDWSIRSCDVQMIKTHLEECAHTAFNHLNGELGGQDRLLRYHAGARRGWSNGLVIFATHQEFRDDGDVIDSYSQPYKFEIYMRAHFTPPIT